MSTELTRQLSPRLPKPDAYAAHVNRILAAAPSYPRPRRLLLLALAMLLAGTCMVWAVFA